MTLKLSGISLSGLSSLSKACFLFSAYELWLWVIRVFKVIYNCPDTGVGSRYTAKNAKSTHGHTLDYSQLCHSERQERDLQPLPAGFTLHSKYCTVVPRILRV